MPIILDGLRLPEQRRGMPTQTRYAGFWIRLIADLIDTALLTVVSWFLELMILGLIYWSGLLATYKGHAVAGFNDAFNPFFLQVFNGILYALIAIPYYVWGHCRYGTTYGKLPFRIYVVNSADLMPISLKQSWIRCVGYIVSYLPFCAGFVMAAYHPRKRALHDLLAGTVSIRKEKLVS
jgi:uncharacterized RDD family membrane protein YckC